MVESHKVMRIIRDLLLLKQHNRGRTAGPSPGVAKKASPSDEKRCSCLLRAVKQLYHHGIPTDDATYASLLRWCRDEKALSHGRTVHAHIRASRRDHSTFLANLLVQMYGKCGSVVDARNVFDNIDQPDTFSWNFMITGYAKNGQDAKALQLYRDMMMEGVKLSKFTFLPILSACASLQALAEGKRIHERITLCGFESDIAVRNALVHMYGKCGSLKDARLVFSKMHERDVISWTAMIAACAQNASSKEAIELFRQMNLQGVKPNGITFLNMLDACANLGSLETGREIHQQVIASGFESDVAVRNALVSMYGKCGAVKNAHDVFNGTNERDVISWTAMITAYTQNGYGKEALDLFKKMDTEGIMPNRITFLSTLHACGSLVSADNGRAIHKQIVSCGFQSDVAVNNALVSMYGKCGVLNTARVVFDQMYERDVISWTAMIAAYVQNGYGTEAFELFRQMELEGVKPCRSTFLSTLDACAIMTSLEDGKAIHKHIIVSGFESDITVRTALVNMYGRCGSLKDARRLFDEMEERDVILWTAMIAAYVENGHYKEAVELFEQSVLEGIKPDKVTFLSILDACASLASTENGRAIHEFIVACGFESDVIVQSALVNMYGKCGDLKDACSVFDGMHERNVISWTAMMTAYAQTGHGNEALELFRQMGVEGIRPNVVTFLSLLTACSHAGLLDLGWLYFVFMIEDYDIRPLEEHYVCMGNLLGRAGYLEEAEDLIMNMPIRHSAKAWTALLGACRIYGDMERGARAAEHVFQLDPENTSPYILLSNIYAAANRQNDAAKARKAMKYKVFEKEAWVLLD